MANECRIIDRKVGGDDQSLAENPMVHALSCQWPFGESKLDLKQSSLKRVRSNNLKLASWRAELVQVDQNLEGTKISDFCRKMSIITAPELCFVRPGEPAKKKRRSADAVALGSTQRQAIQARARLRMPTMVGGWRR